MTAATASMSIGMQTAVRQRLEAMFHTSGFPGTCPVPFTPAASGKLHTYPYTAVRLPPGARTLLMLLTVGTRCIAVLVSTRMIVTRVFLPTIPQSLFRGSVFDGFLETSHDSTTFHAVDCLAFKGSHDRTLSYNQRMIGLGSFLQSVGPAEDQPSSGMRIKQAETRPLRLMPKSGTWIAMPEDLGLYPARNCPDMYIICMDDVSRLLPLETS